MFKTDHLLLTPDEMQAADAAAIAGGQRGFDLMQAAGAAVVNAIAARWTPRPVAVLCGPGNNGGDGFVVARLLAQAGWPVRLGLLGDTGRLPADAAAHAALWSGTVEPLTPALLEGAELVVDAVFGAGLSRPVDGVAREVLEAVGKAGIPVCAVDVPSGVNGANGEVLGFALAAELTVTFFRKKPGHLLLPGRGLCGELLVGDIGIAPSVLEGIATKTWENSPPLWLRSYPWPRVEGHKYARGHALVVGGERMTGAARLAAQAAQRMGAGLVTVAAPAAAWMVYATALTSIMVAPFADRNGFDALLDDTRKNVMLIGPGAGVAESTRMQTLAILATGRAAVLDADAITVFRDHPDALFSALNGACVLTPHEGEFGRLFSHGGGKLERVRAAARESGAVVLLKGSDTVIGAADGRAIINSNAPPTLATGGSGDVLAGMIAGLMAQGMEAFLAAAAATWLHGLAAHRFGPGLVADDLLGMLPRALGELAALVPPGWRDGG